MTYPTTLAELELFYDCAIPKREKDRVRALEREAARTAIAKAEGSARAGRLTREVRSMIDKEYRDGDNDFVQRAAPRWAWEIIDAVLNSASVSTPGDEKTLDDPVSAALSLHKAAETWKKDPSLTRDQHDEAEARAAIERAIVAMHASERAPEGSA